MNTYIALFRGINVGGRNKIPMAELVQRLEILGLQRIRTYIQSGNVIFQSEEMDAWRLAERMSASVQESHGFTPQVIVLGLAELEDAIGSNPYPEAESNPKTLHFYFLASEPQDPDLKKLDDIKRASEQFALEGKVFYLYAPDGIGRSKLAAGVEKALGVPVTARNWRSVCKIVDIARKVKET